MHALCSISLLELFDLQSGPGCQCYPLDKSLSSGQCSLFYSLDSDLSSVQHYPAFKQLGPDYYPLNTVLFLKTGTVRTMCHEKELNSKTPAASFEPRVTFQTTVRQQFKTCTVCFVFQTLSVLKEVSLQRLLALIESVSIMFCQLTACMVCYT